MKLIQVKPHKNGKYWRARWYDHDGVRQQEYVGLVRKMSEKAAEEACDRLAWEINSGRKAPGECPTLAEWVEHHRKVRNVKPSTAAQQDTTIDKYLLPRFGERRMDDVALPDVQTWLAWLRKRPGIESEWTVAGHLKVATGLWAGSVRAHGGTNPFKLESVRAVLPNLSIPTLTEGDVLRVAESGTPEWRAAVALCGLAGLRAGEVSILTWDRILWDANKIVVPQPKTAKSTGRSDRVCLLVPALASTLLECRELAPTRQARVTTAYISNSTREVPKMILRAGLVPWAKPLQTLRMWRASTWRATYPADYVDRWLGHSHAVAMRHYVSVPESAYQMASEVEQLRAKVAELEARVKQEAT